MTKDQLLDAITTFYLESADFNGLPTRRIEVPEEQLRELVSDLVRADLISVNFGDIHPNPHIKAFEPEPVEVQLEKLVTVGLEHACLYPSIRHLSKVVEASKYADAPFTQRLYLGEPQLIYYAFDLSGLEIYRNDPRYYYVCDDVSGLISVRDRHFGTGEMRESDEVLLQTFGFAYDSDLNRAVAVYLWYLAQLSPEHQRIWAAKMLPGHYQLHPDYHRKSMGHFPEGISIFTAFIEEMCHINEMCRLMGRAPLFRNEFREQARPKDFSFLIRPTLREFNHFVHVLDKMLSENIDFEFFQGDIAFTIEEERANGTIATRPKGSIKVLEDWLNTMFRPGDPEPMQKMFATFKKIRKLRQEPAHVVQEDVFDQRYFKEQRQLMIEAYDAIRTLRLILQNHPATRAYRIPEWSQTGRIWTY